MSYLSHLKQMSSQSIHLTHELILCIQSQPDLILEFFISELHRGSRASLPGHLSPSHRRGRDRLEHRHDASQEVRIRLLRLQVRAQVQRRRWEASTLVVIFKLLDVPVYVSPKDTVSGKFRNVQMQKSSNLE